MRRIIFLLLICSCSSQNREFAEIENADFQEPKQIYLDYSNDIYRGVADKNDVLAEESLGKISPVQLKRFKGDDEGPLSHALSYCYRGRFEKAMVLFDRHYRRYKKNAGYWNKLGICYLLKGSQRKALLYYNKARDVSKKYAPPINNLGVIYQHEGRTQKALLAYQKASELGKFSVTPVYNISQIFLQYGLGEKAEPLLNALYRKNRGDQDVANGLAVSHLLMGNIQKSIEIFDTMNKRYWSKAAVGLNYAVALKMSGNEKRARKVFEKIEEVRPQEQKYYEEVKKYVQN